MLPWIEIPNFSSHILAIVCRCYSARKSDPYKSSNVKGLACRSASNLRAE